MKNLAIIVILTAICLPAEKCMSQTEGDSTKSAKAALVEAELISFGEAGLRVRSAAGEEQLFPLDDLQAYRLKEGRLQVKHASGRVISLPPEALGDSAVLREGEWRMISLSGADARGIEVDVIDRGKETVRLRTCDGPEEYEIDDLVSYRVRDDRIQVKHTSGMVLVIAQNIANKDVPASSEWKNISGENAAQREALFPGSKRRGKALSDFEKEMKKAFGDVPMSLIWLGIACLVVDIAFLICFGLVICTMLLNGEITTGLLCVVFTCVIGGGPLMGLYYGWSNCQAWRIQKLMIVWSVLWVVGLALNVIVWVTLPDLLAQIDPRFAGCQ